MWFGETPSSSIVCNGHLAALLMPISAYAGQAMAQWPPAPQAIMFGFTRWKGLIGSAHAPDWTCFTPVGLHRIKGSPSPPGTIIRTHTHTNTHTHTHTHTSWAHTAHRLLLNLMFSWLYICLAINTHTHTLYERTHEKANTNTHTPAEPIHRAIWHFSEVFAILMQRHKCDHTRMHTGIMQMTFWRILTNITRGQCCLIQSRAGSFCHFPLLTFVSSWWFCAFFWAQHSNT